MTSPSTDRRFASNSSLAIKAPCRVATTAAITLSGEQTIDGVAVVSGDRVLVKDQSSASANGIYIADTSAWDRSPDFDGNRDVTEGTLVRVNEGTSNGDAWFSVTTTGSIVIGTTSITFGRENTNVINTSSVTASAGQTVVTVPNYQPGNGSLQVYVNGLRQRLTADYAETSTTSITFAYALQLNDEVDLYVSATVGSVSSATGALTSIADSADYYVGTNVEAVLAEIGLSNAITADNGDADATLTYNSSSGVQRWNSPLSANRTATLSTSNAKEGAGFLVVRGSGATGNFTLSVGSLATLRAPGEWAAVRYDAGTTSWVLAGYGGLPSAEIVAMSADKGDADATITVGTSERTSRWATTLTADRTATLATAGAWNGARLTIVRTEAASGNFSLNVAVGATRLLRLATGQWATFEYTGSTWIVTGFGNLRSPLGSQVELREDFVGNEIDGYKWQSKVGTDADCRHAVVLADQTSGVVRLTTGDDAAATMAVNGVHVHSALNWKPSKGGLVAEFTVAIDTITSVAVFVGLTDQTSTLEMPFTLAAGDTLTSNASNAVGVLFDTAADTDNWWLVGVAADIDAAKQNTAVAPVAGTFETWRIEISATGTATFYRNGTLVGIAMSGATTPSVLLTPVVAAFSRTNASRNIDVDGIVLQQQR